MCAKMDPFQAGRAIKRLHVWKKYTSDGILLQQIAGIDIGT